MTSRCHAGKSAAVPFINLDGKAPIELDFLPPYTVGSVTLKTLQGRRDRYVN